MRHRQQLGVPRPGSSRPARPGCRSSRTSIPPGPRPRPTAARRRRWTPASSRRRSRPRAEATVAMISNAGTTGTVQLGPGRAGPPARPARMAAAHPAHRARRASGRPGGRTARPAAGPGTAPGRRRAALPRSPRYPLGAPSRSAGPNALPIATTRPRRLLVHASDRGPVSGSEPLIRSTRAPACPRHRHRRRARRRIGRQHGLSRASGLGRAPPRAA